MKFLRRRHFDLNVTQKQVKQEDKAIKKQTKIKIMIN